MFSANGFHPLEKHAGPIRYYRERWEAYGHELSGISLEVAGLSEDENRASVETFVTEVMPALRSTYPSRLWA